MYLKDTSQQPTYRLVKMVEDEEEDGDDNNDEIDTGL